MLPHTKLGLKRVMQTGLSARQLAGVIRDNGGNMTLRRLRAIELGEVSPSLTERKLLAKLLSVPTYEVQA